MRNFSRSLHYLYERNHGFAADGGQEFTTYTESPDTPGEELLFVTGDMERELTGYDAKGGIGVDLYNLASGGTAYCLKNDTSTWYDFEVSEKTDVTFYIGYIARPGSNRGIDYSVDDPKGEHRVFIDLEESADQQWVSGTFTVEAGKHTFYLYAPTGMDDSNLKSCDVYTIELYGNPASDSAATTATEDTATTEATEMEAPVLDYPSMDNLANSGAGYATLEEAAASIGKTAVTDVTFVTGSNGNNNEGSEISGTTTPQQSSAQPNSRHSPSLCMLHLSQLMVSSWQRQTTTLPTTTVLLSNGQFMYPVTEKTGQQSHTATTHSLKKQTLHTTQQLSPLP